jgi:glycosyltransferase involved in cell wall biosynthesis
MEILVGIPTHKRPELLRKCLASIEAQEGELPNIRVFVADNDAKGKEGSAVVAEIAPSFRFPLTSTVVEEPGISAVRNAILEEAKARGSDFIAMIDDDETASPQWLAELLKVQKEYGADVVGAATLRVFPPTAPAWLRNSDLFPDAQAQTGPVPIIKGTGNVLLNCDFLARLEWPQFDNAYGLSGGGDSEFFLRLRSLGSTFAWSRHADSYEQLPSSRLTAGWVLRREFRYGNVGDALGRKYGTAITPGRYWAAANLLLSPLLLSLMISRRHRVKALRRLGYSSGIIASALGVTYLEYASRHGDRKLERSGS